jgi:hypothetical protein
MRNELITEFRRSLEFGHEIRAYEMLINTFEEDPSDPDLFNMANELSKKVFDKAYALGSNKATEFSSEAETADVLVRLAGLLIKKVKDLNPTTCW